MGSLHNHITRNIEPVGVCTGCNLYWLAEDSRFATAGEAAVRRMHWWLRTFAVCVPGTAAVLSVPEPGQLQATWTIGDSAYSVTLNTSCDILAARQGGTLRTFTSSGVFCKSAELAVAAAR